MSECGLNWLFLVHRVVYKHLIKASFTECQPESNGLCCLWPPRLRPDAADTSLCSTSAQHGPSVCSISSCCSWRLLKICTLPVWSYFILHAEVKTRCEWLKGWNLFGFKVQLPEYNANGSASCVAPIAALLIRTDHLPCPLSRLLTTLLFLVHKIKKFFLSLEVTLGQVITVGMLASVLRIYATFWRVSMKIIFKQTLTGYLVVYVVVRVRG